MYIVLDIILTQEYEPAYDYHEKAGYRSVERTEVKEFENKEDVEVFLSKGITNNIVSRRIFSAQELSFKTTLVVNLVPKQ